MSDESTTKPSGGRPEVPRILIVVGAHMRAEVADRPLAYTLRDAVNTWRTEHGAQLTNVVPEAVVITDVWYLNNEELHDKPTIALGGPGINALSQAFAQSMDHQPSGDSQVLIQFDPEYTDLRACVWGTDHALTKQGLELFIAQYLDGFLQAVVNQVEPQVD